MRAMRFHCYCPDVRLITVYLALHMMIRSVHAAIQQEAIMIKSNNIDEHSEQKAGTQHKPESSRPVIYTFPRPLFSDK